MDSRMERWWKLKRGDAKVVDGGWRGSCGKVACELWLMRYLKNESDPRHVDYDAFMEHVW